MILANHLTPSKQSPCRVCKSDRVNLTIEKPPSPFYGALRCGQCDCFLRWLPKPVKPSKRKKQQLIETLLKSGDLSDWEREFLSSLQRKKKPSSENSQILDRIFAQHGGMS